MRGGAIPEKAAAKVRGRSEGLCEAYLPGCLRVATEIHHIKSRARGGSNRPINLLHVCHSCHSKITIHDEGTDKFRTFSWQEEGQRECDFLIK